LVNVVDGLQDAPAAEAKGVMVSKFQGLVSAHAGPGRHGGYAHGTIG
jgi:hypothetical protein